MKPNVSLVTKVVATDVVAVVDGAMAEVGFVTVVGATAVDRAATGVGDVSAVGV